MGRNSLEDFKKSTLLTFYDSLARFGLKEGRDWNENKQDKYFFFTQSGSYVYYNELSFYPSDPDYNYLGSTEYTWAFIDEANQVRQKAKSILRSRIRYKLAEYGLIPKLLMTCNPDKGYLHAEFYKPHKQGTLSADKAFVQALAIDNKFIDPTYIKNLQGLDPVTKERLLFGNWDYDNDPLKMMEFDAISDLFTNVVIPTNEKYITADIARLGGDKIVFGYWEGFVLREIVYFQKMQLFSPMDRPDEPSVFSKLVEFRTKHQVPISHIIVDEDGMGGGIKDSLGCKGFVNNSTAKNGENYANLKTQCYYKMAKKVNEHAMSIVCSDPQVREWIIEELEQVKQKDVDKDKKLSMVGKDEVKERIGRSPDFSDMIAMRIWFELIPRPKITVVRM